MKVVWVSQARQDLAEIVLYIAEDNPLAAMELDEDILSATDALLQFPHLGRQGKVKGTRELIIRENYVIVYVAAGDEARILAVVHASRQWPPLP